MVQTRVDANKLTATGFFCGKSECDLAKLDCLEGVQASGVAVLTE